MQVFVSIFSSKLLPFLNKIGSRKLKQNGVKTAVTAAVVQAHKLDLQEMVCGKFFLLQKTSIYRKDRIHICQAKRHHGIVGNGQKILFFVAHEELQICCCLICRICPSVFRRGEMIAQLQRKDLGLWYESHLVFLANVCRVLRTKRYIQFVVLKLFVLHFCQNRFFWKVSTSMEGRKFETPEESHTGGNYFGCKTGAQNLQQLLIFNFIGPEYKKRR